jgi:hypothetical protein
MTGAAALNAAFPSRRAYAAQVHSTFRMHLDTQHAFDIELTEVTEGSSLVGYEQFSLFFQAPPETPPLQNVYRLEHPHLGSAELLLVPVGTNALGVRFQAVFSVRAEAPGSGGT